MPGIGTAVTGRVVGLMTAPTGLPYALANLLVEEQKDLPAIEAAQIAPMNVAADVVERTVGVKYPAMYVYCESIANLQREKFRTFSGRLGMVVEVRASHDRLEALGGQLELYTSAVTAVLDAHRGDWGSGLFYTGGYKVEFGQVKRGGRNFVQSARVHFDVEGSV